jgi:hypothetical protein
MIAQTPKTAARYFRKQRPIVGGVPHFDPSAAPPLGQYTDARISFDSQFTGPSA